MSKDTKGQSKKRSTQRGAAMMGKILTVIGILIFVGAGYAWWTYLRNDPQNTFEAMLRNTLRTSSVTRSVNQNGNGRKVEQLTRAQNGPQNVANGVTTVKQGIQDATVVVTDSIGTPTVDYVKYSSITTTQKSQKGKALTFDKVVNVWSKNDAQDNALGELYQDTTLGNLFMLSNLPADKRKLLLDFVTEKNVYDVKYNEVTKSSENGRPKYTYKVTIHPVTYISYMKEFAQSIGLTQLDKIDPSSYQSASPIAFSVKVDVISQRLESVTNTAGGSEQNYGGYGIMQKINLPTQTIPVEELQQRLTESASV